MYPPIDERKFSRVASSFWLYDDMMLAIFSLKASINSTKMFDLSIVL